MLTLDSYLTKVYHRCEAKYGCEVLTRKVVVIDGHPLWFLCDAHFSKFEVERLMKDDADER